ncbi:MAG: bifunctional folylpolyglutamate synthase/dihydrofolate synthase [Clostridia bacterium]|nr:bifunctional folylpolyglutamate synthase/dihydrofolate synthase [Clostridia bacterium]
MDYNEALNYLDSVSGLGSKLDLERISVLLEDLGNPQDRLKAIHVAGTNGKGSVCSMLRDILTAQGYKTALYTSPHLERYNERYVIGHDEISDDDFAHYMDIIKEHAEKMTEGRPTVFEQLTAMAFLYFADNDVDYAVIEVGLGGRFDATNVIKKPVLSVITSISFDHTEFLGNTLESIAFEKGGIIKPECPVVLYRQDKRVYDVIKGLCEERDSKLYYIEDEDIEIKRQNIGGTEMSVKNSLYGFDDIRLPLVGEYQIYNCLTVLLACYALNEAGVVIGRDSIVKGIENTGWNGRMEVCSKNPVVVLDGAHNPDGINMLAMSVKKYFSDKRIVLLMGVLGDKQYEKMAEEIVPMADTVVITEPDSDRALSVSGFKTVVKKYCDKVYGFESIGEAYGFAKSITGSDDVLLCAGSLYLIGRLRTIIMGGN